nr:cGMP-dependent kinase, protein kinase C mu-related protein [Tanacetum cinerariifolium]
LGLLVLVGESGEDDGESWVRWRVGRSFLVGQFWSLDFVFLCFFCFLDYVEGLCFDEREWTRVGIDSLAINKELEQSNFGFNQNNHAFRRPTTESCKRFPTAARANSFRR